jgi:hypothetical protein
MASRNACKYTDDGRFDDKRNSQFPAFERAILNQATQCLDQWRDSAIETANGLVRVGPFASDSCRQCHGYRSGNAYGSPYNVHQSKPDCSCAECATPARVHLQVDMEQDYVTAAFFRHAIAQRQEHLQQLEDMQQIMDGESHFLLACACAVRMVDCACTKDEGHGVRYVRTCLIYRRRHAAGG